LLRILFLFCEPFEEIYSKSLINVEIVRGIQNLEKLVAEVFLNFGFVEMSLWFGFKHDSLCPFSNNLESPGSHYRRIENNLSTFNIFDIVEELRKSEPILFNHFYLFVILRKSDN
jgi:hypothetical protein